MDIDIRLCGPGGGTPEEQKEKDTMDPIVSTALATAHRADLLRAAEAYRRSAAARTRRHPRPLDLSGRVRELAARLRRPAVQAPAACCA
jgi:hypothetical protein